MKLNANSRKAFLLCCVATSLVACAPSATSDSSIAMTALGTQSGFSAVTASGQAYTAEPVSVAERSTALAARDVKVEKPASMLDAMRQARARGAERSPGATNGDRRRRTRIAALQKPVSRRVERRVERRAPSRKRMSDLPGVRKLDTMGGVKTLKRIRDAVEKPVRVAAAATLGRIGNHGLRLQRENVRVGCLPRRLVTTIKQAEKHFGRPAVVTSGFRSKKHNRRIGGAKNSMHVRCMAADVQIAGITKWQLAKYFRSLPDRGGVGTYCHTASVHVDTGPQRDWNWRCRRRKR